MSRTASPIQARIQARIDVDVSAAALRHNYRVIRRLVPGLDLLPMIKADGYGHGAEWAARELMDLPGLDGFGVATLEEGALLRRVLGTAPRIVIFSGAMPWTEDKGHFCVRYRLTPVLGDFQDWKNFRRGRWPGRVSYELKFDTGMNRLGIPVDEAGDVLADCLKLPRPARPDGILSHLAQAEAPATSLSRLQFTRFTALHRSFAARFDQTRFHLGNSAAIWNAKAWNLLSTTDIVRPGLALYGIPPWEDAPLHGLKPVMTFRARVLTTRWLEPGERLGYGGRFQNPHSGKRLRIAVLGVGYADGVHRLLSKQGEVYLRGRRVPFLGTISMDLSAVLCPPNAKPGDQAEVIGPHLDLWKQAHAANTIPYELLTAVKPRAIAKATPHR